MIFALDSGMEQSRNHYSETWQKSNCVTAS